MMLPLLCHLGHEGARHTGRFGFGGRWSQPASPYVLQYHTGTCEPHFLTTAEGWVSLKKLVRPAVIGAPVWDGSVAQLQGGYDDLSVFIDSCPCTTIATEPCTTLPVSAVPAPGSDPTGRTSPHHRAPTGDGERSRFPSRLHTGLRRSR